MEQERITLIILVSTIVVLVFTIAMVVLTSIYLTAKHKLQTDNESLRDIISGEIDKFNPE